MDIDLELNHYSQSDLESLFQLPLGYDMFEIEQKSQDLLSKLTQFSFSYNSSLGYIFTPFDENRVEDNIFIFNKSYNTFLNQISYLPIKNIDSYGNRVINLTYQFNSNNNLYISFQNSIFFFINFYLNFILNQ